MRTSLTFGTIAGIPLKIHINWFLTVVLVTWSLAGGYFPQEYPGWTRVTYWSLGALTAMLFFASVLLHELGHAMLALREQIPVNSITLFIFGGVAQIAYEPPTPGKEFRIVIAGPLTSLALAAVFGLVSALPLLGQQVTGMASYLSKINLVLAIFNMIPGFPLDGGRVLRSFLWKLAGSFRRATRWATAAGFLVAGLFVVGGLAFIVMGDYFSGLWLAFIGWYLATAAQHSYRYAMEEDEIEDVRRPPRVDGAQKPFPPLPRQSGAYGTALVFAPLPDRASRLPFVPGRDAVPCERASELSTRHHEAG